MKIYSIQEKPAKTGFSCIDVLLVLLVPCVSSPEYLTEKYCLSDEDIEALRVLFSRRKPDSPALVFHPPTTKEEEQEQFELFKRIVEEKEGKKDY